MTLIGIYDTKDQVMVCLKCVPKYYKGTLPADSEALTKWIEDRVTRKKRYRFITTEGLAGFIALFGQPTCVWCKDDITQ